MSGTKSDWHRVLAVQVGYGGSGAVSAGLTLVEFAVPFPCRLGGVVARAEGAGSGTGNTVLDVTINDASVWSATGNRPTLASALTGEFANAIPDHRALRPLTPSMDRIRAYVVSTPTVAGHTRVSITIALESPDVLPGSVTGVRL